MPYQIMTDSCCDLTRDTCDALQIPLAPLTLILDEAPQENFTCQEQVDAFYDRLRQGAAASTAAVNPEGWKRILVPALDQGKDVLVLCFSGALSATCQAARIAAEELAERYPSRRICICDTLCACLGQGFLVYHACQLRDQGADFDTLCRWVEEHKLRVCHWFTVDDLNHLRRGGRVSSTAAILGTMLNVKPVLHLDSQGLLKNRVKIRGRKTAIHYLADIAATTAENLDTAFIAQGGCPEDARLLETLLKEKGFRHIHIGQVGPVIGAHTGPGVLALFFWGPR